MSDQHSYSINLDIAFGPLERFDIPKLVDECTEPWYNQTLCAVNDSVVRLGIIEGDFHWHKHDEDDEFFYVVSGRFIIELEDGEIDLSPGQGCVIPKGVMHCPRAPEPTVILMVETSGVQPTGD